MHQQKPKEGVKTLSIRIPTALYLTISQYALDNDHPSMNAAIIELLASGIAVEKEKGSIIGQFSLEVVPKDKLKEIINGN